MTRRRCVRHLGSGHANLTIVRDCRLARPFADEPRQVRLVTDTCLVLAGEQRIGLFGRLEASFTAQRHFVASASHELRTPLTLDRTLLRVALRNPGTTAEQWRATARDLLESGQHRERLLEALLALATSEGGITTREPADLSEVVAASLHAASARIGAAALRREVAQPGARARRP